jgi:hypothetical protein
MTTTVTFDDFEPGTTLTDQLEHRGILFTSPCLVVRDPENFRHSLQSSHQSTVAILPTRVIRGRFIEPHHSRLAISASFSHAGQDGLAALLRVFDVHGHQIDERTFGSIGSHGKIDLYAPGANIAAFEVSGRTNRWDAIDAIEFDHPETPDFRIVYDALHEPIALERGTAITTRIHFQRLHGSHGEILLSVTKPCPGTTWDFDPPTVLSGTPYVDVQIRANEDAPSAYRFAFEVVGFPRRKTAGVHEHKAVIWLSIVDRKAAAEEEGASVGNGVNGSHTKHVEKVV